MGPLRQLLQRNRMRAGPPPPNPPPPNQPRAAPAALGAPQAARNPQHAGAPLPQQPPLLLYSADEILVEGLKIAQQDGKRMQRVQRSTNIERFKDHFAVAPLVLAVIWEDLQTTSIPEARIDTTKPRITIVNFLHTLWFIKRYPTEKSRSGKAHRCERYMREVGWDLLERVAALKGIKVRLRLAASSHSSIGLSY